MPSAGSPCAARSWPVRPADRHGSKAVAHSDRSVQGSYSFRVASGGAAGSSTIQQGGDFEAGPGRPATLGVASFGGSYDAALGDHRQRSQCGLRKAGLARGLSRRIKGLGANRSLFSFLPLLSGPKMNGR